MGCANDLTQTWHLTMPNIVADVTDSSGDVGHPCPWCSKQQILQEGCRRHLEEVAHASQLAIFHKADSLLLLPGGAWLGIRDPGCCLSCSVSCSLDSRRRPVEATEGPQAAQPNAA